MRRGREFQIRGAEKRKARDPTDELLNIHLCELTTRHIKTN